MTDAATQILTMVENKRKLGVIGGALKDYYFYKKSLDKYTSTVENMCIVSVGHNYIKQSNAEDYANELDVPVLLMYPNPSVKECYWRVLEASDMLVIFYDGKSWLVWDIIQECKNRSLPYRVINI